MHEAVVITECPRDAFQGLGRFIPTEDKIAYMNALTRTGFRRIDFGSFVSPKAVPQMADTVAVFENMQKPDGLYLIGIIGNLRGIEGLVLTNGKFARSGRIQAAGYPLSVSETFQQRNLGRAIDQSWDEVEQIASKAVAGKVDLIVYLSMAFGNPYGDPHSPELVVEFARRLAGMGVGVVSLADTIGSAEPEMIGRLFEAIRKECPDLRLTAHFHSRPDGMAEKIDAALEAGCRMFDSALAGIGGCPFAKDDLTGNVDTAALVNHLEARGFAPTVTPEMAAGVSELAARYAAKYGRDG